MTQLEAIAQETHEKAIAYFKVAEQYGYKFIMEVKEIRDKQYYKALGFTSFDDYCLKAWNTKRDFMDQRIQIADSSGNESNFADTYRQLGHSKSLLLARMEPEIRQQVEQSIDVNESTVKQLKAAEERIKEAERAKQEAEQRAAQAANEAKHWKGVASNQPVRVETRTVEVAPESMKKELEKLKFENTNLRHGYKSAKEKLQEYEMRDTVQFDAEEAQKQRDKLQHEADLTTIELRIAFKHFIEKAAITSFLHGAIATASNGEKERLAELVESAEQIINQTKMALRGRRLGVVNE